MSRRRRTRNVKLGRIILVPVLAYHWAIKVGDIWYEIQGASKKASGAPNKVNKSHGSEAQSGAGSLGGELVGKTDRTNEEIEAWIENWLAKNPEYDLMTDNCQTFVFDLMVWLTKGNYVLKHRMNAANVGAADANKVLVVGDKGTALARYCLTQGRGALGPINLQWTGAEGQLQTVAGPGLGLFVDATAVDARASFGNVIGGHVGFNLSTGVGVRNGNIEAHWLGFGGKIGADGIEINSPFGGINACSVM